MIQFICKKNEFVRNDAFTMIHDIVYFNTKTIKMVKMANREFSTEILLTCNICKLQFRDMNLRIILLKSRVFHRDRLSSVVLPLIGP